MRGIAVIIVLIILCSGQMHGQENRRILYSADMGYYDEDAYPGAQRLIGHVRFKQDNVVGYCDSAYLYEADNYIIAYGSPVRFVISDSIHLHGRRATYDGEVRQAVLAGHVRLENGRSYLLTDSLFYDLNTDCGSYTTGARIFSEEDTLSSVIGRYYTATDDADFLNTIGMCGNAQRPDKVLKVFTFLLVVEHFCCSPDDLENDLDSALFLVGTGDGKRNSFTVFTHSQDDKLPRFCLIGNQRCFDLHLCDSGVQRLLTYNSVHRSPFLYCYIRDLYYQYNYTGIVTTLC